MSAIYHEIKRLIPENFTKIIAYINTDVNLTNQINDALALYDTNKEKRNYLISFLESLRAGFSREPTGLVHVFIDNSNVEIEGKKFVSNLQAVFENQLCLDYGRLLGLVLNGRQMGEDPVIVGSRPPPNDSLWKEIEDLGFQVKVHDRIFRDKEKEVDNELGAFISDAIQEHKRLGIIVLVAGDGDHSPFLRRALLRGWIIEVWFWTEGNEILQLWIIISNYVIINLDPYYLRFIYAYRRENTGRKIFLEIEDIVGSWDSENMMECYEELNLFCWWWHKPHNTFYMYFDEYEQWREAKHWIQKKYSNVAEYKK
ncbi:19341_t:CDS:2, partial [Funneliformis geosporum]